jgi:hypothetical protein
MTQINLMLADQRLIVAQKVKIAAGDINSVVLHADFDAAWDEFTDRKVIFANDSVNGGKTQDILLIGNECIVPHEVLAKEGVLFISVTGYTTDGTTRKTSSIAKMKVSESLADATTTIAPTMDLYMQYLAAMDSKTSPLFAVYKAEMDAYFAEKESMFEGVVLWENPNPTAKFAAQTVALDLSEYKRFKIVFISPDGSTVCECYTKDVSCRAEIAKKSANPQSYVRNYKITNEGAEFYDATSTMSDTSNSNTQLVPIKIIGYKLL